MNFYVLTLYHNGIRTIDGPFTRDEADEFAGETLANDSVAKSATILTEARQSQGASR